MHREVGSWKQLAGNREQVCPWLPEVSRRAVLSLASGLAAVGFLGTWAGRLVGAYAGEFQQPQHASQPTPFEQLHLPTLRMPSFTRNGATVPVVVEMTHPMTPDHCITSLQIVNPSDPIPSKGVLHLTPSNGQAYLAVQARMHSGTSSVQVIAECNQHGRWTTSQAITIPEGTGGCATVATGQTSQPANEAIRPPVIRLPELVRRGTIRAGEIIRVQVKFKHPNRTGLGFHEGTFHQEAEPFYIKDMQMFYGERLVSRYEMTPALSDNPFLTFKLRATEEWPIRIVFTNNRGQRFQASTEIRLS